MLALRGGYHGDTFGAMSVCDPVGGMHSMFTGVLRRSCSRRGRRAASTPTSPPGPTRWRRWSTRHADELAAIIVEPVLQGAGGMHVYDPACLGVLRDLADAARRCC